MPPSSLDVPLSFHFRFLADCLRLLLAQRSIAPRRA